MAEGRTGRSGAAALLALVLVSAVVTGVRGAGAAPADQGLTGAQLQTLARRAASDPAALAQLRAVRQVDGRPVDLDTALAGAQGRELGSRLAALAGGGGGAAPGPADARADAAAILGGRRFKPAHVPRPLAGALRRVGSWLEPVARPVGRLWSRVSGTRGAQLAVAAVVALGALVMSQRMIGRRSPSAVTRARPGLADGAGLDPDDLDRDAGAAEAAGDLDGAVRLRFLAGVLRLDRSGVIAYRPSLTTGQLSARLRSPAFAGLASAFDEIAYGGRPAGRPDVEAARSAWPRVLHEAGR